MSTMSITPALPSPVGAPPASNSGSASNDDDKAFSKLLSQHQPAQKPAASAPARPGQHAQGPQGDKTAAPKTAGHDADESTDAAASESTVDAMNSTDRANGRPGADRVHARATGTARERGMKASADSSDATPAAGTGTTLDGTDRSGKDKSTDKDAGNNTAAVDPALAHVMASLNPPSDASASAATTTTALEGKLAVDVNATVTAAGTGTGTAARELQSDRATARGKAMADDRSTGGIADAATSAIQVADAKAAAEDKSLSMLHATADKGRSESRAIEGAPPASDAHAAGLAALQAFAPAAGNAPAAPAAPVDVSMATAATSPEFREALGVQVSVLAKDGVHHAELHLNPADMGPISVQIALDGTRAQIDFGADSSATRHIIESGLPELASALRDAGFTLSGGGVSQHSRQGADSGQSGNGTGHGPSRVGGVAEAGSAGVRRVSVRAPQGAVDLYA